MSDIIYRKLIRPKDPGDIAGRSLRSRKREISSNLRLSLGAFKLTTLSLVREPSNTFLDIYNKCPE